MTDGDALLSAIRANPEDDTPRLVYADWLDEQDPPQAGVTPDSDRAEFIRLQCSLPALRARNAADTTAADTTAAEERCALLLRENETAWRRAGPCPQCGTGTGPPPWAPGHGGRGPDSCPTCSGTGDRGGLLRTFGYTTDPLPGRTRYNRDRELVRVEFRRGFPHRVEVPQLSYCVIQCSHCDGDGKAHGSDRPFEYSGPASYPGPCPGCHGAGFRPTPWLAALVAHHPVEQVVLLDREPAAFDDFDGAITGWFRGPGPGGTRYIMAHVVPPPIWDLIDLSCHTNHITWKVDYTREGAVPALGRAVVKWATARVRDAA